MTKEAALRQRFGRRVQLALDELKLSAADLAEQCDLPHGQVERIVSGARAGLTLGEMALIACCLGAPLHAFLTPALSPVAVETVEVVEER